MKKIITAWILIALCVCVFAVPAYASGEVYTEGYFYYRVQDRSITIIGYFGNETEATVPASIAGLPVNTIATGAFTGSTVQVLHLPGTIMSLEPGATGNASVVWDSAPVYSTPTPSTPSPAQAEPTPTPTPEPSPTPAPTAPTPTPESVGVTDTEAPEAQPVSEANAKGTENGGGESIEGVAPENIPMPKPTPSPKPSPSPTPEPTEAPEASAEPEATPEAETQTAKSGGALGWIIGAAVLVCGGGAAVVLLRKKGGKA